MNIHELPDEIAHDTHRVLAVVASDVNRYRTTRYTPSKVEAELQDLTVNEIRDHLRDLVEMGFLTPKNSFGWEVQEEALVWLYERPLTAGSVSGGSYASRPGAREVLGLSKEGTLPTAPVSASRSSSRERTPLVKPNSETQYGNSDSGSSAPSGGKAFGPRTLALGRITKSTEHSMTKPVGVARWFQERCAEVAMLEGAGRANDVSVERTTKHLKDWVATGVLLEDIVRAMELFLEGDHFDVRSTYPAWSQFWYRRMDLLKAASETREMEDWSEEEDRYG